MHYVLFDTDLGKAGLVYGDRGLTLVALPEKTAPETEERLQRHAPGGRRVLADAPAWVRDVTRRLTQHLGGEPQSFDDVPVDLSTASPFAQRVYDALRRVPAGKTVSYGELAEAVGAPGAARAVGRAMASNPVLVIVPCHRVLAAGGKRGGFSAYGGLTTKERLLAMEGTPWPALKSPKGSRNRRDAPAVALHG